MAWLAVAVFAVGFGLAAGWLLDRLAGRYRDRIDALSALSTVPAPKDAA